MPRRPPCSPRSASPRHARLSTRTVRNAAERLSKFVFPTEAVRNASVPPPRGPENHREASVNTVRERVVRTTTVVFSPVSPLRSSAVIFFDSPSITGHSSFARWKITSAKHPCPERRLQSSKAMKRLQYPPYASCFTELRFVSSTATTTRPPR